MPTTIRDLPIELLNRVFTVGCEEKESQRQSYIAGHAQNRPRMLKRFAAKSSLVCRGWHTLIHEPSNYHFRVTLIRIQKLGSYHAFDIGRVAAHVKDFLSRSQSSDIDVFFTLPSTDPDIEQRNTLTERLMVHLFSLLIPFGRSNSISRLGLPPTRLA